MLLISPTLSKLAVSASLICVLMVLLCVNAARCVRLYNSCSRKSIGVDANGRVYAADDDNGENINFQNLTIRSKDFTGKLTIYAEHTQRYLCFNHKWKLVGSKRHRGSHCMFYEEMFGGYFRYRSVADESRYIGFNKKGRYMKDTRELKLSPQLRVCLNFLKLNNEDANIARHNSQLGSNGNDMSDEQVAHLRKWKNREMYNSFSNKNIGQLLPQRMKIRHKNHHRLLNDVT